MLQQWTTRTRDESARGPSSIDWNRPCRNSALGCHQAKSPSKLPLFQQLRRTSTISTSVLSRILSPARLPVPPLSRKCRATHLCIGSLTASWRGGYANDLARAFALFPVGRRRGSASGCAKLHVDHLVEFAGRKRAWPSAICQRL